MTTILMVTSLSRRALDQESLVVAWLKKGYRVIVLNFFDTNPFKIPGEFVNYNFVAFKARSGFFNLLKTISKVASLCWRNKVDCLIAHLEYPSFVSVIVSFFTAARVVVYRHHADFAILNGLDKRLSYKFTYRFAPVVVVVSNHAKRVMIDKEKVRARKIKVVRLAFDFKQIAKPPMQEVLSVKNKYNATVLLLSVGRLTQLKRPHYSVHVAKSLIDAGVDAKLILLGVGEERASLEEYIRNNNLQENIILYGFSEDPLPYIMAADFILHPSISESSSIVVKEAGLMSKPCFVCRGVGDFDEYIVHYKNGFLVNPDDFVNEACQIIKSTYQEENFLKEIGKCLHEDILRLFEVNNVIEEYDILLKNKTPTIRALI